MIKTLSVIAALLLGLSLTTFVFKEPIKQQIYAIVTSDMFLTEDSDEFDPGVVVGKKFPAINAIHSGNELTSIAPLMGEKGTVFVASRSFDWCPYCMRQLLQLQEYKPRYEEAGINIVTMTYDTSEVLRAFAEKNKVTIPLLSDVNAETFTELDILNSEYGKDDEHYGLPFPGMIVVDTDGMIVGKLFVEAYSTRVDAQAALDFAISKL